MIHELKIWSQYFDPVVSGKKTAEIRKVDRGFTTGDTIILREFGLTGYSDRTVSVKITHILSDAVPGIEKGYAILSFSIIQ